MCGNIGNNAKEKRIMVDEALKKWKRSLAPRSRFGVVPGRATQLSSAQQFRQRERERERDLSRAHVTLA